MLDKNKFSNPDNDPRGPWKADPFDAPNIRENLTYAIVNPNTGKEYWPPKGRCWRTEENKYNALLSDNRILFGKTGNSGPQLKVFWDEKKEFGEVETTWWGEGSFETYLNEDIDIETVENWTNYGTATSASQMLQQIFGDEKVFETPKPVELIKHILTLSTDSDSIVLDSFAGSGTTAQAVLELNKEDGGNRKFILVEQEDYADTLTAERVRRVIKGISTAKSEKLKQGLGGSFSYFTLGNPIEMHAILEQGDLPNYNEMARYLFYTATGESLPDGTINEANNYVGESTNYQVYLYYKPDIEWLKQNAFTLNQAKALGQQQGKQRLVFAPLKYVDDYELTALRISFCQLPYEIYRLQP
jgi:adenine-specific DNA-methyltransferase